MCSAEPLAPVHKIHGAADFAAFATFHFWEGSSHDLFLLFAVVTCNGWLAVSGNARGVGVRARAGAGVCDLSEHPSPCSIHRLFERASQTHSVFGFPKDSTNVSRSWPKVFKEYLHC